jgi:hypothetical protein
VQELQIPEVGFSGFSVAYAFHFRCLAVGMNPGLVDRKKTSQEDKDGVVS